MNRACEDDKTLVLDKAHGFCIVIVPKKIVNPLGSDTDNFTNNAIIVKATQYSISSVNIKSKTKNNYASCN